LDEALAMLVQSVLLPNWISTRQDCLTGVKWH